MSSLPLISHHLFVAAIDDHSNRKSYSGEKEQTRNIELEFIDDSKSIPETSIHPLHRPPVSMKL